LHFHQIGLPVESYSHFFHFSTANLTRGWETKKEADVTTTTTSKTVQKPNLHYLQQQKIYKQHIFQHLQQQQNKQ